MARTPTGYRRILSRIFRGAVLGLVLAASLHAATILGGGNFRTVLPGQVYRCAQPSKASLTRYVRDHGIRTVVNLRGCCPNVQWYREEAAFCAAASISLEDINFSATRLPSPASLSALVEVIDRAKYPILFHCHQGADRTGLAAVLTLLLRTQTSLDEALIHLGPATGHLPVGRTRHVDLFFEMYREWLIQEKRSHSPEVLREWLAEHYCPAECRGHLKLVGLVGLGAQQKITLQRGVPEKLTIRCQNTSGKPWRFQPGNNAGVHLSWILSDETAKTVAEGAAGRLRREVFPKESIDLVVAIPGLASGKYDLLIDLVAEQHGTFIALGNEPLALEVVVP